MRYLGWVLRGMGRLCFRAANVIYKIADKKETNDELEKISDPIIIVGPFNIFLHWQWGFGKLIIDDEDNDSRVTCYYLGPIEVLIINE